MTAPAVGGPAALSLWWDQLLHHDRVLTLPVELPWFGEVSGRGVFNLYVTLVVLAVGGVAVAVLRQPELRTRWTTWVLIAPVVGIPIWLGRGPTALLAVVLAVLAVVEFARLVALPTAETWLLLVLAVVYPVAAWHWPDLLFLAPAVALGCALPAILRGDTTLGVERAAFTAFGSIWLCWSLAHLVVLWEDAFVVVFAAAAADVAAYAGGKSLRRFRWAARPLSPLSPNKTVGGLVGAVAGAVLILLVLGELSVGMVVAVAVGGVLGDLLESMMKRRAGVKDAGAWLPGFGGLLDRVDSLLVVLPLAAVLG